jgi:hypothetical protein
VLFGERVAKIFDLIKRISEHGNNVLSFKRLPKKAASLEWGRRLVVSGIT